MTDPFDTAERRELPAMARRLARDLGLIGGGTDELMTGLASKVLGYTS